MTMAPPFNEAFRFSSIEFCTKIFLEFLIKIAPALPAELLKK